MNASLAQLPDQTLGPFLEWLSQRRLQLGKDYQHRVQKELAAQQRTELTRRALLATVLGLYDEALNQLAPFCPSSESSPSTLVKSPLTDTVLAGFRGLNSGLLVTALGHNAGSCALSNFPLEHQPDPDYLSVINADLASAWRDFALSVNARLCGHSNPISMATPDR